MALHLNIIGVLCLVLAVMHVGFPRYFHWEKELSRISLINRQMMQVHTFFLALVVFLMGILLLGATEDMLGTRLGRFLALGLSAFWGVRLLFQFFVYSPVLWRGKPFETTIHILFSILWAYFTVVFYRVYAFV